MKTALTHCDSGSQKLSDKTALCRSNSRAAELSRPSARITPFRMILLTLLLAAAARVIFCPVPLTTIQLGFLVWAMGTAVVLLGANELRNRRKN